MDIEFMQSWRFNRESGYKAWYGFVVLTDQEVITFAIRRKHGEPIRRASPNRSSDKVASYATNLIENGKAKKITRIPRSQIATVAAVPKADRLAITMHDGEQHMIKQFPFADELERVAERLAVALFHRALGEDGTMAATGSGLKGPTLGALGTSVLVGGGLIVLALIGANDSGGRRQWLVDLVAAIPLPAAITIGVLTILTGLAFRLYRSQAGFAVTEWRPDDELLAEHAPS